MERCVLIENTPLPHYCIAIQNRQHVVITTCYYFTLCPIFFSELHWICFIICHCFTGCEGVKEGEGFPR